MVCTHTHTHTHARTRTRAHTRTHARTLYFCMYIICSLCGKYLYWKWSFIVKPATTSTSQLSGYL